MKIEKILEELEKLFRKWGLTTDDWIFWGEYASRLLGYNIQPRKGHLDVVVDGVKLPWKTCRNSESTIPPKNSKEMEDFKFFVKKTKFGPHITPLPFYHHTIKELRKESLIYTLPNKKKIRIMSLLFELEERIDTLLLKKATSYWDETKIKRWVNYFKRYKRVAEKKNDKKIAKICEEGIIKCQKLERLAKIKKDKPNRKVDVFSGKVTYKSRNKIRGKVKVIKNISEIKKLQKGDILVTPMATPDFILCVEKTSAIITDLGGALCHAAIISRELKIPCIIGTGIATKVLKDGDKVEIDMEKGSVRKIK